MVGLLLIGSDDLRTEYFGRFAVSKASAVPDFWSAQVRIKHLHKTDSWRHAAVTVT